MMKAVRCFRVISCVYIWVVILHKDNSFSPLLQDVVYRNELLLALFIHKTDAAIAIEL